MVDPPALFIPCPRHLMIHVLSYESVGFSRSVEADAFKIAYSNDHHHPCVKRLQRSLDSDNERVMVIYRDAIAIAYVIYRLVNHELRVLSFETDPFYEHQLTYDDMLGELEAYTDGLPSWYRLRMITANVDLLSAAKKRGFEIEYLENGVCDMIYDPPIAY